VLADAPTPARTNTDRRAERDIRPPANGSTSSRTRPDRRSTRCERSAARTGLAQLTTEKQTFTALRPGVQELQMTKTAPTALSRGRFYTGLVTINAAGALLSHIPATASKARVLASWYTPHRRDRPLTTLRARPVRPAPPAPVARSATRLANQRAPITSSPHPPVNPAVSFKEEPAMTFTSPSHPAAAGPGSPPSA